MTDAQLDALARINLCLKGSANRTRPQVLSAEQVQAFYSKRSGTDVSLDDTFRILARHNARRDTVPVFTRSWLVKFKVGEPFTPPYGVPRAPWKW